MTRDGRMRGRPAEAAGSRHVPHDLPAAPAGSVGPAVPAAVRIPGNRALSGPQRSPVGRRSAAWISRSTSSG